MKRRAGRPSARLFLEDGKRDSPALDEPAPSLVPKHLVSHFSFGSAVTRLKMAGALRQPLACDG